MKKAKLKVIRKSDKEKALRENRKHPQQGFVTYYSWPLVLLCLKKNKAGEYSLSMSQILCSAQDLPTNVVAIPPSFQSHPMAKYVMIKPLPDDMNEENRKGVEAQIQFYSGFEVEMRGKDMKLMICQGKGKPAFPVTIAPVEEKKKEEATAV